MTDAAEMAFAYLPDSATIGATVYPMIKWRPNSYVWELSTDPAIFLYLDPELGAEEFENTVAHELHHVGFRDACSGMTDGLPEHVRSAVSWMGTFAEGWAMLAAAGGPNVHPHAVSSEDRRAVWDANVAKFPETLERMERFFLDVSTRRGLRRVGSIRSAGGWSRPSSESSATTA